MRQLLLVATGAVVLVTGGVAVAMVFVHGDGPADVPPARAVAGAYWTAVEHKNVSAIRRLLCDDDRVLIAPLDDQTLLRSLFPDGRRVVGYSITGQQDQADQPVTVVSVEVVRVDGGRVHTVTRPTPVIEQRGMFIVCFHTAGLYPGA